jgi:hypothetical protein
MIQTLRLSDFTNAFRNSNRDGQFSYEALELIFDYIEEYESETGEQIEFDMIGICCEWSEDSPENIIDQYDIELKDHKELEQGVFEYLNDHTQVAGITAAGTIVYVQF